MPNSLAIIKKYFPHVTRIVDATRDLKINVTDHDAAIAKEKDHTACGFAQAIKRTLRRHKVIVGISRAFVIEGNIARRYSFPESARREIVSNDRGAGFEPGEYTLKAHNASAPKATSSEKILELLRKAGPKGVAKGILLKEVSSQSPARICEMQDAGYDIVAKRIRPCDKLSTYFLVKEPPAPRKTSRQKKARIATKPYRRKPVKAHKTGDIRAVLGSTVPFTQ